MHLLSLHTHTTYAHSLKVCIRTFMTIALIDIFKLIIKKKKKEEEEERTNLKTNEIKET